MASNNVSKYLPEVRILCGLPGSGKTTEALRWVEKEPNKRTRINYDSLRLQMYGPDWKFNRKEEDTMQASAKALTADALKLGMSVVIDNTNLTTNARQPWIDLAKQFNASWEVEEIDTPIWTCIQNDYERKGNARVGRAVIERMALFNGWIDWKDPKAYKYDGYVICDLDGTLCDVTHRRHHLWGKCKNCGKHRQVGEAERSPGKCLHCESETAFTKDWPAFFAGVSDDDLNVHVADLLEMFEADGMGILLVSGRPLDLCGKATEDWLYKWGIKFDHLFMRGARDARSDVVVKSEILDLLPKDKIEFVIDDRPSVIRDVWQKAGLFTLTVGSLKEF